MQFGGCGFQDPWQSQVLESDPVNMWRSLHPKETAVLTGKLPSDCDTLMKPLAGVGSPHVTAIQHLTMIH